LVESPRAIFDDVLGAFLRPSERRYTPGDYSLHHFGIGTKSRRAFARVEHAESPRCSGANVEQASATAESRFSELDRARDRFTLRGNDLGNSAIFSVYQVND